MSGRITEAMIASSTLGGINAPLQAMQRSAQELSSGRAISRPSDDPYGASRAVELQSALDGLEGYSRNAQDASSWTQTAGSAMQGMNEILQRVRELVVQAGGGVESKSDLQAIAGEVGQLTEALKQDTHAQYAGQYVFSGTLTATAPYAAGADDLYRGDTGTISRTIGPGVAVTINTDLSSLMGNGPSAEDGKLLDVLHTVAEHLGGASSEDLQALSTTDLKSIDSNLDTLTRLQGDVGAMTDRLRVASSRIEDLHAITVQALSGVQDTDFAKSSIAYSSEQTAYQAALRVGASIMQMPTLISFLR